MSSLKVRVDCQRHGKKKSTMKNRVVDEYVKIKIDNDKTWKNIW